MDKQDQLRELIKPYINSVNSLAKKWDIDPVYFHKWYNGMRVGSATLEKIEDGVKSLVK